MDLIARSLQDIAGGKVLDVATHQGHFVQILANNLQSFQQIVGIDIDVKSIEVATAKLPIENVQFMVMDAESLAFGDDSFDTVNISASLHHLANVSCVLNEMGRVLKPGGHFILVEMHRDGQTEAMQTSIDLHHWVAEVDTAHGTLHHKTFSRQMFLDFIESLGLSQVVYSDYIDVDTDPGEKQRIAQLEKLIESTIQRVQKMDNERRLTSRGYELLQRLHDKGVQREPIIMIVGTK